MCVCVCVCMCVCVCVRYDLRRWQTDASKRRIHCFCCNPCYLCKEFHYLDEHHASSVGRFIIRKVYTNECIALNFCSFRIIRLLEKFQKNLWGVQTFIFWFYLWCVMLYLLNILEASSQTYMRTHVLASCGKIFLICPRGHASFWVILKRSYM